MLKGGVLCLCWLALASALRCPDGGLCEDGSTCCRSPSGRYSCCPLPHAVCCEDHKHCCFEGTVCDVKHSECLNKTSSLPWVEKVHAQLPEFPLSVSSFPMFHSGPEDNNYQNVCPDNTRCPWEYACLQTAAGSYGCCPLPQAVSCADGRHCCPEGYQCSEDGTSCTRSKELSGARAIICPDGESECPSHATCCPLPDGSWGCCPLVQAICCDDKKHCCPQGTRCDMQHSRCLSGTKEMPMWSKISARKRAGGQRVLDVNCPDGVSKCPDNTTCCQKEGGGYGCCPFPDAVCCTDHLHCCPSGTTCDLEHNTCTSAERQTPLQKKLPALLEVKEALTEGDVNCPDGVSKCPDNTTCCQKEGGGYGCCPFPDAVCCTDHLHCCPSGTTCDLEHNTCTSAERQTPLQKKLPALLEVKSVKCNDTAYCPHDTTCCKTAKGEWACCPFPKAVCCEDHAHCCPQGTTCDLTAGYCKSSSLSVPWLEKEPAKTGEPIGPGGEKGVKCDPETSCAAGTTCCQLPTGKWGCCPLVKGVCCSDHEHCCPQGYSCNIKAGTCEKRREGIPWVSRNFPVVLMSPSEQRPRRDVQCDEEHRCPDSQTCCRTSSSSWGCCPFPKAVCCDDQKHCCPSGYSCDGAGGSCVRDGRLTWDMFFTERERALNHNTL